MAKTNAKTKRKSSRWQQTNIYTPKHSSGLILLDRMLGCREINGHFDIEKKQQHKLETKREEHSQLLILRCHGDGGVIWRGILPLLQSSGSFFLRNFAICLLNHFSSSICENLDNLLQEELFNAMQSTLSYSLKKEYEKENRNAPLVEKFHVKLQYCTKGQVSKLKSMQANTVTHIILLPPHPSMNFQSYSSHQKKYKHLFPERLFSSRLIRMQNNFIQLQTLNAYLSTMGGGYFMCRHLNRSIQIARQQCQVALSLGNIPLALKCRLNEAYNYIFGNQLQKAFQTIEGVYQFIKKKQKWKAQRFSHVDHPDDMEYVILLRMCRSAKLFGTRVQKEQKFIRNAATINSKTIDVKINIHGYSNTHDDYQRVRICNKAYFPK